MAKFEVVAFVHSIYGGNHWRKVTWVLQAANKTRAKLVAEENYSKWGRCFVVEVTKLPATRSAKRTEASQD